MAGGRGSRLAPYTTVIPKPLMPLGDRPIIDVLIRQAVAAGADGVAISVGHLGGIIESWVGREDYGVPVSFLHEDEPLGTAGALRNVEVEDRFLAMNGDVLTTLSFADVFSRHRSSGALATVAVTERSTQVEYGVVHTDESGRLVGLEEKPKLRYTVSMGIYAFDPEVRELIAPGEAIDFPDLLWRAVEAGRPVATHPFEGYWRDIGNPADYEQAIADFAEDPARFLRGGGASVVPVRSRESRP
jgi:NDP-sugar pyrophosphorylase family protein